MTTPPAKPPAGPSHAAGAPRPVVSMPPPVPPSPAAAPADGKYRLFDAIRDKLPVQSVVHESVFTHPAVIKVEDFKLWYGKSQALHGITMPFPKLHVTALIGPSGCGKSTLLRSINRLNDFVDGVKVSGTMTLHDEPIYAPGVDLIGLRRRLGMVFQKANPFPMSIFDNVAYPLRIMGERNKGVLQEACERSLKAAALWDEVKDRLRQSALGLSGGQQQRLCIARALANQPEVLLLDEPTSALDPIATARIEELIDELKERVTIVIVTHNMQQAARISDYTAFMYLGKLVEFGRTADIFQTPRCKETEDYVTGRFG